MKTIVGKLADGSGAVMIEFDEAIQSMDEIISPTDRASIQDFIAPGFVDVQVNGFGGVDFNDPKVSSADLLRAARLLASTGVTRCLPTVITGSRDDMSGSLRNLTAAKAGWQRQGLAEAHLFAGFHVEGPHLSPEEGPRGAHPLAHIRPPHTDEFDRMQDAADGQIRIVTLSPEWDDSPRFIENAVRQGVVASIGHTRASAAQLEAAVDAGATMSTHLGNGAHSLLHKTQNYIWEQLAQDKLNAGFIADGIHLPSAFLRAAFRSKGLERCFLVTDAVAPALCPPGVYALGDAELELRSDGSVVLRGTERLAGSGLRMDRAIANVIRIAGLSLQQALALATMHPARAARLAGRMRGMAPGEKADFVRFRWRPEAGEIEILETIIGGMTIQREATGAVPASL